MKINRPWTTLEMLRWTSEYLAGKGIEDPRLNAELLLSGALGIRRLDLYLQFDRPLKDSEIATFKAQLLRRARREPLQYIAGYADFRQIRLRVDQRVLIPRPETELLVGEVLQWSSGRTALRVLDVGTGSGAIALSLAVEGRFEQIIATDLSDAALAVAAMNLEELAPASSVELRQGALYEPVAGEQFDIIVSNPPYIGENERDDLDVEVREWEPGTALFSGSDGLDIIRQLVAGAADHLRTGGLLALEIGTTQAEMVSGMVEATGAFRKPVVRNDLTGRERMIIAELARGSAA
ncbi:peptide chain release factor N(5)-glutamine methyltransferase [soil metagenome]